MRFTSLLGSTPDEVKGIKILSCKKARGKNKKLGREAIESVSDREGSDPDNQQHLRQQQQKQHQQQLRTDPQDYPVSGDAANWETVVRNTKKTRNEPLTIPDATSQSANQNRRTRDKVAEALVRRRTPRTEAVTISEPAEGVTYASIMRTVVSRVKLSEIGVEIGAVRRTRAGGILLQVKSKEEADKLSGRLQSAVADIAKIGRPIRTTPVLITNVPDWMDDSKVEDQIRALDSCLTGVTARIRENSGRGKVAITNVPMETASRLAEAGRLKIGWSLCRVKLLERKKPACHRCLKPGHFKAECKATDAERLCFRCKRLGYLIRDCPGRPLASLPSTDNGDSVIGLRASLEGKAPMLRFLQSNVSRPRPFVPGNG